MKCFLPILLFTFLSFSLQAQERFVREKHENLSFVTLDTLGFGQSTIIEYDNFLVLIEIPLVSWEFPVPAAERGDKYLAYLNETFPNKPVKYIISSHWHPHSLSYLFPLLEKDTKLIVTSYNLDESIKQGYLSEEKYAGISRNIMRTDKDTVLLQETDYPLHLIYLDSSYEKMPTTDYLCVYFPVHQIVHTSCLCYLRDIDYDTVKMYAYSERLLDVERMIQEKELTVKSIIRLDSKVTADGSVSCLFPHSYVHNIMTNGKSPQEMIDHYATLEMDVLFHKQDSLLKELIEQKEQPILLNQAAYQCLENKETEKAIKLAQLLNLFYPGSARYMNTLGECHYIYGNEKEALYYNGCIKRSDKEGKYGLSVWKENINTYKQ